MNPISLLVSSLAMIMLSCSNGRVTSAGEKFPFKFEGIIEKPDFTSYMYGSHTISNNDKVYALQSTTINLDEYINKKVVVKGVKVKGYPLEGGPEFIDVKAVEKK